MGHRGYTSRKLLIASVGVATINYLVAGCGDEGDTSANLMIVNPGSGGSSQTGGSSSGGADGASGAPDESGGGAGADGRG